MSNLILANSSNRHRVLTWRKAFPYVLTLPVVIALLGLLLFPLVFALFISTQSSIAGGKHLVFVGLKNYYEMFKSIAFLRALWVTGIFVAASIAATTLIGFFVALLLNDVSKGRAFFKIIITLPLAITPVVSGLTWRILFDPSLGLINFILGVFGIPPLGWASEPQTALLTLILVDAWQWTPFMTLILYAGMQMLPIESYESARLEGASRYQEMVYVTLPLLRQVLSIALVFRFMDAFKAFDVLYVITKGGPGWSTQTLTILAFFQTFKYHRLELGAVIGVVFLIMTYVITKFALKAMPKEEIL